MAEVVVLRWERTVRELDYVPVNGGSGGDRERYVVSEADADDVDRACAAGPLPRVGELEVDGDVCMLELAGPPAVECSVKPRGGGTVRLTDVHRNGARVADLTLQEMGVSDPSVASKIDKIGRYLYFGRGGQAGVAGCWIVEGGLDSWLRREREAKEAAKEQRDAAKKERETRQRLDGSFVNPYTFAPFPAHLERQQPGGHRLLGPERLSGTMTVRWEFTSPFQVPEATGPGQPLRLPGASVKGAVRSLHETLAGGCLRVLDEEFVPSYRDTASVLRPEWTMAMVETVTRDGQPLTVKLCDTVVWVQAKKLKAAWRNRLRTGSRVTVDADAARDRLGRLELPSHATVTADGEWVVLLTDGGARRPEVVDRETSEKREGAYFTACGHLPDDAEVRQVTEPAWQDFRRAVAGAREVQERAAAKRAGKEFDEWKPANLRKKPPVGKRKAVADRLDKGDLLWVRRAAEGETVEAMRLSAIWRHAGTGSLGKRVPRHLLRCTDPAKLCPSCRLFGSADTRPRQPEEKARQRSYAGHVRFGDAVTAPSTEVPLELIRRAPLGAPRPGAGQFYLRYESTMPAAREEDHPTREWGARPDEHELRQVRGRKFYWHADPEARTPPRHRARQHQEGEMVTGLYLAPAGTVLTQTVTFDNLSRDELGGLIATLEPHLILPLGDAGSRPLRLHLGGGKPLGLGSCVATVEDLRVWTVQSRYGDADPVAADPDGYLAAFVAATPAEVTEVWPAAAAVLAADTVDATRVWYPPGRHWSEQQRQPKDFDEPFAFFTGTSGMFLKEREPRPLIPLPEPTAPEHYLPIIRKDDLGKG